MLTLRVKVYSILNETVKCSELDTVLLSWGHNIDGIPSNFKNQSSSLVCHVRSLQVIQTTPWLWSYIMSQLSWLKWPYIIHIYIHTIYICVASKTADIGTYLYWSLLVKIEGLCPATNWTMSSPSSPTSTSIWIWSEHGKTCSKLTSCRDECWHQCANKSILVVKEIQNCRRRAVLFFCRWQNPLTPQGLVEWLWNWGMMEWGKPRWLQFLLTSAKNPNIEGHRKCQIKPTNNISFPSPGFWNSRVKNQQTKHRHHPSPSEIPIQIPNFGCFRPFKIHPMGFYSDSVFMCSQRPEWVLPRANHTWATMFHHFHITFLVLRAMLVLYKSYL